MADFVANRDAVRAAATTANAERAHNARSLDAPQAAPIAGNVNSATTSAMTAPATTHTPGYQLNKAQVKAQVKAQANRKSASAPHNRLSLAP